MKVVLLAGGLGTRLNEETQVKPKPMVEIGGKPIIWHIMKIYSHYGFNEFIICLGYKSHYIKEWFSDYFLHNSDFTLDMKDNSITYHKMADEKWKITFVDTGHLTMTGGRIKRIKDYVGNETFMMTYGDGVANINVKELVDFHKKHKKLATITSVFPEGRFGTIFIDDHSSVTSFSEKTDNKNRVNGGFFVLEPKVFDYLLEGDETVFEKAPLEKLAKDGQLKAYHHDGFWKPMDTLNDKNKLEDMWSKGNAPWKVWV
jgi:glucose-1-phosphate cytidylyltransferase